MEQRKALMYHQRLSELVPLASCFFWLIPETIFGGSLLLLLLLVVVVVVLGVVECCISFCHLFLTIVCFMIGCSGMFCARL